MIESQIVDKTPAQRRKETPENLADGIYGRLKQEIFDFQLLPSDRFTESEVAQRMEVSRTPVREALFRLQREGYVEVLYRSGWQVKPFDFRFFEEIYDVRIILELAAVKKLCEQEVQSSLLTELKHGLRPAAPAPPPLWTWRRQASLREPGGQAGQAAWVNS